MRNQAIAGALVAALLAFDIVGFMRCVAYLWPSLGPLGLVLTLPLRFKFKNASPAARAGLAPEACGCALRDACDATGGQESLALPA